MQTQNECNDNLDGVIAHIEPKRAKPSGWRAKMLFWLTSRFRVAQLSRNSGDSGGGVAQEVYPVFHIRSFGISLLRVISPDTDGHLRKDSSSTFRMRLAGAITERILRAGLNTTDSAASLFSFRKGVSYRCVTQVSREAWFVVINGSRQHEPGYLGAICDGQATFTPEPNDDLPWMNPGHDQEASHQKHVI